MAFRKCVEKNSKAFSGKFVEVPILKKKYNSNIFVYKSPWSEDCLSFEFMSHFDRKTNSVKKFLFPSNGATIRNFNELVDSWNEFVSNYKIMEF